MSTTIRHSEKAMANGKWLSRAVARGEDIAQDTATEIMDYSQKLAKRTNSKAMAFGKAHPVQVALAGISLGFILGSKLFSRRN